MMTLGERAEAALRIVREAPIMGYDTETSGVDWKRNSAVGYVIAAGRDSFYVPVRHGGGGNLLDPNCPALVEADSRPVTHRFEVELAKAFRDRARAGYLTIGHNLKFDYHFSANHGILLGRNLEDTQINEALLDEFARSYSLDACARTHGVTAKKGEELYERLAQLFGGKPDRDQMGNYWRLAGDDPVGVEYAIGDGITTLELREAQYQRICQEDERGRSLAQIHQIENQLTHTVFRMERRGIKIDQERLQEVIGIIKGLLASALDKLPRNFNTKAPSQVKAYLTSVGRMDWPMTEPSANFPNGQPSFAEKWLKTFAEGKLIVDARAYQTLFNSFITPLVDRHLFNGRVFSSLNPMKTDEFGTISGRFSSSNPNLQQVPKRNKRLAKLFRSAFVPDEGFDFWEADYSQCLAAGTQVMVPSSTKNIEDMKIGDWVYTFTDTLQLTLRKVTWAGRTGVRRIYRVHWMTNGRTKGYLDATSDHPIRLSDGTYKTVEEMIWHPHQQRNRKAKQPVGLSVMALRRATHRAGAGNYKRKYLWTNGRDRISESRFLFEHVHGWSPEEVHHKDEDSLNNHPDNLQGVTRPEHQEMHRNNHIISYIEPLPGLHPVYDITVEDTHNFIANEICVHNCEPRLFAHYSGAAKLVEGYNATPHRDMHAVVAEMLNVERDPTAKRMGMGILTGMQDRSLAGHMGWDLETSREMMHKFFEQFPEIKVFQDTASAIFRSRGYIVTLLNRICRLDNPRFAYRAVSRIIQGGNADILKKKLLDADLMLEQGGDLAHLLMTVHDSIEWQAPSTPEGEAMSREMIALMSDVQSPPFNLKVPFAMDVHHGRNWSIATFGDDIVDLQEAA